jgi:hypothetical protein
MPRTILPTTANSLVSDWTVVGSSGWEAVLRNSADNIFVTSSTLADKSTFNCGSGTIPISGRVMAVSFHYRMRQTVAGAGAVVDLLMLRNDIEEAAAAGSVALTTDQFVEGVVRLREDPVTTNRFTPPGTALLGVGVEVGTAPSSGAVEVSQLWVEVEFVDSPVYYDPYDGNLPDAVPGDLLWTKLGTQPTTLVSDFLNIDDTDTTDTALFYQTENELEPSHITEIETRHTLNSIPVSANKFVYGIGRTDGTREVSAVVSILSGTLSLGLAGSNVDLDDPANYLATAAATDLVGRDIHLRLRIDRDDDAMTRGKVQLFVDYDETPLLEAFYNTFPTVSPPAIVLFGSGGAFPNSDNTDIDIDYFSWQDLNKRDNNFGGWKDFANSTNVVVADTLDADIVQPISISPPGITAGQSTACLFLDINDDTAICEVSQLVNIPTSVLYKLDLDYKSSDANTLARVSLQRTSDFFYWNNGTSLWQAAASSVTVAFSATRTRASVLTSIDALTAPDVYKVTIDYDPVGGPLGPREVRVYKVFLKEE